MLAGAGTAEVADNGLARTPPMGWNSWNRFAESIDDANVREIADALVTSGLRDAGYVYVNIDAGGSAIGLFNRSEAAATITLTWRELGLRQPPNVRDLWARADPGRLPLGLSAPVPPHGCALFRLMP